MASSFLIPDDAKFSIVELAGALNAQCFNGSVLAKKPSVSNRRPRFCTYLYIPPVTMTTWFIRRVGCFLKLPYLLAYGELLAYHGGADVSAPQWAGSSAVAVTPNPTHPGSVRRASHGTYLIARAAY